MLAASIPSFPKVPLQCLSDIYQILSVTGWAWVFTRPPIRQAKNSWEQT